MYKTADQSSLRYTNRLAVLQLLFDRQTSSRSQLARELHISKPAVADNLSLLLALGIVQDTDSDRAASTGCKPRQLVFNNDYCYFAAIDMHYGQPIFALGNVSGTVLDEFTGKVSGEENWLGYFCSGIDRLLYRNQIDAEKLAFIAISSPGIFRTGAEEPYLNKHYPGWFEGGVLNGLAERYGVRVFTQNDANAAAVGEYHRDKETHGANMLYISCGIGVGAGLILDGDLFPGSHNAAGELGASIDPLKRRQGDTLESTIFLHALLSSIQNDIMEGAGTSLADIDRPLVLSDVVEAYKRGDPYTLQRIAAVGDELGCAVVNAVNLLTVHSVVLGGEYDVFADTLIPCISELVKKHCLIPPVVSASKLGRMVGVAGLFTLVRHALFEDIAQRESAGQDAI